MQDPASGRTHRFTPAARVILNGMDGGRTIQELWEAANRRLGENAPSQDELIQLVGQLHASDLVQCDVSPDVVELFERARRQDRWRMLRSIGNPMSIKVPLIDPDRFLNWLSPYLSRVWNRWGVLAWLAIVAPAIVLIVPHWSELTDNLSDRVLATNNLFMLWLLFPCIKILHELGHGVATKMRGGEVHDLGIMLLVMMPVPYVDASAASVFRSKFDRAIVGAAGILVEVLLAAIATYIWLLAEPGTVRAVAFNVMLMAGVSTLLFNGNPFLRYDGYYVLADIIEMPNLATRSSRYLGHLVERYAFGVRDAETVQATTSEKAWFVFFAITSFFYRTLVSIAIILFIAGEFFVVGVLLALWAFTTTLILPIAKAIKYLARSPRLARVRGRVHAITFAVVGGIALFICVVPMPFRTQTEGVVWLPEQSIVRAGANGFHARFLTDPGTWVSEGEPLMESADPVLDAEVKVAEARVAELQATFDTHFVTDRVEAAISLEQLGQEQAALSRLKERLADLIVHSGSTGQFLVPQAADMPGRFFKKGDLLGYVTDRERPVVRVVVQQADVDVVRLATRKVELRSLYRVGDVVTGTVLREVPGGIDQIPSRALGVDGGGLLAVDPRDSSGTKVMQRAFQLDIALPVESLSLYGGRVLVRFEHIKEPLASQWYRGIRRLFLTRFDV